MVIRGAVLFLTKVAWSSLDTYDPASLDKSSFRGRRSSGSGSGGGGGGGGVGRGMAEGAASEAAAREARDTLDGRAGSAPPVTAAARGREKLVVVRVHNDDVHTVEEVRHAFMHLGMSAQVVSFC